MPRSVSWPISLSMGVGKRGTGVSSGGGVSGGRIGCERRGEGGGLWMPSKADTLVQIEPVEEELCGVEVSPGPIEKDDTFVDCGRSESGVEQRRSTGSDEWKRVSHVDDIFKDQSEVLT